MKDPEGLAPAAKKQRILDSQEAGTMPGTFKRFNSNSAVSLKSSALIGWIHSDGELEGDPKELFEHKCLTDSS